MPISKIQIIVDAGRVVAVRYDPKDRRTRPPAITYTVIDFDTPEPDEVESPSGDKWASVELPELVPGLLETRAGFTDCWGRHYMKTRKGEQP